MEKESAPSLRRERLILLVGALISGGTAILSDYFNDRRESRRLQADKMLEFNSQVSDDLGERAFATFELLRSRSNNDTLTAYNLQEYQRIRERWKVKIFSYQSLIARYYGEDTEREFMNGIYNPLVELGRKVERNQLTPSEMNTRDSLSVVVSKKIIAFVRKIYERAEQ